MSPRRGSEDEYYLNQNRPWRLSQWFRKMDDKRANPLNQEDFDHISAIEFDETGRFLATGDKSGNVVVLENDGQPRNKHPTHYNFFTEFPSHWHDFNHVRGEQIEAKIQQIKFGPSTNDAHYLLTTNEKDIKLWKVKDKERYQLVNWNISPDDQGGLEKFKAPSNINQIRKLVPQAFERGLPQRSWLSMNLKVPKKVDIGRVKTHILKRQYKTLHDYGITSLGIMADKQQYISGDMLRVNLWDFSIPDRAYNVLDIKPADVNDINEVLTCVDAHPTSPQFFLYGTTIGNIMTCDLRQRANVDEPAQVFASIRRNRPASGRGGKVDNAPEEGQSLFDEISCLVSDAKYSKGGRFIISRDYMSIRIWDVNMDSRPVETIYVHEYLRKNMFDLYEKARFLDSFDLGLSSSGNVVTGTYSNYFHILDFAEQTDTFIEAGNPVTDVTSLSGLKTRLPELGGAANPGQVKATGYEDDEFDDSDDEDSYGEESEIGYPHMLDYNRLDFKKKMLHAAWHPNANAVVVSVENNVFIYGRQTG